MSMWNCGCANINMRIRMQHIYTYYCVYIYIFIYYNYNPRRRGVLKTETGWIPVPQRMTNLIKYLYYVGG